MTTFAIDFDGTCVEHDYPRMGPDVPGAVETLGALVAQGHSLILWTMRSGDELAEAVGWFEARNIALLGANVNESQKAWTDSPKVYAHVYIDDAALGCPLIHPSVRNLRACEGIKGTSCRFAGRASPGARSGAWQGRATDEQQRMVRPAKRPCGPALCVRPGCVAHREGSPATLVRSALRDKRTGPAGCTLCSFTGPKRRHPAPLRRLGRGAQASAT